MEVEFNGPVYALAMLRTLSRLTSLRVGVLFPPTSPDWQAVMLPPSLARLPSLQVFVVEVRGSRHENALLLTLCNEIVCIARGGASQHTRFVLSTLTADTPHMLSSFAKSLSFARVQVGLSNYGPVELPADVSALSRLHTLRLRGCRAPLPSGLSALSLLTRLHLRRIVMNTEFTASLYFLRALQVCK